MDQAGAKGMGVMSFPKRQRSHVEQVLDMASSEDIKSVVVVYQKTDGSFGFLSSVGNEAATVHFVEKAKVRFLQDKGWITSAPPKA